MHEKQLYVQENFKSLMDKSLDYIQHKEYPWDPYPAVGMKIMLIFFLYITKLIFINVDKICF